MPDRPPTLPFRPKHATKPRPSTTARGYGHAHQKARKLLLARTPICEVCRDAWATDMHHADGDTSNRDRSNLVAVCEACHHSRIHGGR